MDPNKETMTNASKAERDSGINSNSTESPREAQLGQGDMSALFPTRSQNPWQNTSHLQRLREPRPQNLEVRPGRSSEPAHDSHNCGSGSNHSSTKGLSNSNGDPNDSATPGSSSDTNNRLDQNTVQPCSSQSGDADNVRENRKRPSSLKLNRPNMDDDSSSISDYSLGSEDGCIYTYRGGEHLADLPSSFFSLDMGLPADRLALPNYAGQPAQPVPNPRENGSRASSPDMDFLEMDFDPGPSNEVDSGEESTNDADLEAAMEMPEENEPVRLPSPIVVKTCNRPNTVQASGPHHESKPSTSRGTDYSRPSTSRGASSSNQNRPEPAPHIVYGPYITHVNARGDSILVRRTMSHSLSSVNVHVFNGELIPRLPPEVVADNTRPLTDHSYPCFMMNPNLTQSDFNALLPAAAYHSMKAQTLISEKKAFIEGHSSNEASSEPMPSTSTASASCVEPPRSMIWSEEAACDKQVTQIGVSACGATAIVNVFYALGVPVDVDRINTAVGTRQRTTTNSIPRYILSRAVAGCTAADLINGIQIASGGLVTARFFPTYPERAMSLSHFLSDWISLGGVPILTLNLQNSVDTLMPDAWHHQMVFGVSPQGLFLSNPLECVRENIIWPRLVSPSVLLVKARDIADRYSYETDLTPLMYVPDARFHTFNVFGQVANVIRESRMPWRPDSNPRTRHIRIPAAYQAGITIAVLTGTEAHQRLMIAPQLPLLDNRWSEQNDPA